MTWARVNTTTSHQEKKKGERGVARVGIKFFVNKRRPGHFHYLKTKDKTLNL